MIIRNSKKKVLLISIALLMLLSSIASFFTVNRASAELDPASNILCKFDDGQALVNFYSTDSFPYMLRSKSAVVSTDDVEANWLNKILGISGFKFAKTNEAILGRELNPTEAVEDDISKANEKAPKVSAFDRFGMAGLKWSSYQGEWKYYEVNACASQESASPTEYGGFYEGRKEPMSTYNEVSTSPDARSVQFNKGVMGNFGTAFADTFSNFLFMITKIIVTLTITFVGLSFTDITTMLGMLDGDGAAEGIFKSLFDGIFSGFVVLAFVFTGVYIMYNALIKRQVRMALNTLVKTIIIFFVAFVMATNPTYWISMPNKIATYGQAIVVNATSSIYTNKDDTPFCETDVASISKKDIEYGKDDKSTNESLEEVGANMRSMVGCRMWETLLFKPWVRGQFGAEYKDLAASNIKNVNESWVGSPKVPLGDGKEINNWALFQLSTQTNAHRPVGAADLPTLVNGVNADWWRVVDALSNYQAEDSNTADTSGQNQQMQEIIPTETTKYWQSWVGNNGAERFGTAILSVLFGIFGSLAPLVFGVASAIYGLGLTLLMMLAPIFLLFGTWGGKGDSIFFGWLSAVINTIIKKIGAGLLLVISLSFSMIIMDMISSVGFVTSFMLMALVSTLLIKNKDKILDMLASVDFGGAFDPRTKANQFLNSGKSVVKNAGKSAVAGVAGGVASQKTGQGFSKGVRVGVGRQLNNKLYTSKLGREILRQKEISGNSETLNRQFCMSCHTALGVNKTQIAYEDDDGNYYCVPCAEEMGLENLYEVIAGNMDRKEKTDTLVELLKEGRGDSNIPLKDELRSIQSSKQSWMSHSNMRARMDLRNVDGKYEWDNDSVEKAITGNLAKLREDFAVYTALQNKVGSKRLNPPSPPEPIAEYIDLALINMAWVDRDFEKIDATYKEAWSKWYEDNSEVVVNVSEEQVEIFKQKIIDFDEATSEVRVKEIIEDLVNNEGNSRDTNTEGKNNFTYVNGKLIRNDKHMEDTDKLLDD